MSKITGLVLFSVIIALSSAAENSTQRSRPKITRTALNVARSLHPSDTELLQVRSKNGEIATLIVKRREGKKSQQSSEPVNTSNSQKSRESHSLLQDIKANVPQPIEIRSDIMYVKDDGQNRKKGRTMTIENGVPVIEGIREPDSLEDKIHTWRNAKVINGVLIPYKHIVNGDSLLKQKAGEKKKPEKQEVILSSHYDTKKNMNQSMPGETSQTQWKGVAESIPTYQILPSQFQPLPVVFSNKDEAKILEYIMKINQREMQNRKRTGKSLDLFNKAHAGRRMDENVDENEEPIWVNTHPKEIWTENGKISVADRRVDRIEEESDTYDKDDKFIPIAPIQARLLQPAGVSNYPTSSIYSSQPSRVSFEEGVRTPVLQYAHPELGAQPAKVERDIDEIDMTKSTNPHSSMPSLTYFSNDPYADRSPYAYEPGLISQAEDSLSTSSNLDVSNSLGSTQDRENVRRHSVRNIEFTTSSSESSSINPDEIDITESPNRLKSGDYYGESYKDSYGLGSDNYVQSYHHGKYPGKYSMSKEDYYKWKMSGMSYGNNQSPGYYIKISDNRPLWEKIKDSIKETVQSGVESVKEMTRPVMEPIVEATHRISENLGIPEATAKISNSLGFNQGTGMRNALQEKIGAAASSSPVLLPALGLVGAGAALGLGAVAVGRLLDVNVNLLSRSNDGGEPLDSKLTMEHKRTMEGANGLSRGLVDKMESSITELDGDNQRNAKTLLLITNGGAKESESKFKRLVDESGIEGLQMFQFDVNEDPEENKSKKRALVDVGKIIQEKNAEYLSKITKEGIQDGDEFLRKLMSLDNAEIWSDIRQSQLMLCKALTSENLSYIENLEKKIYRIMPKIEKIPAESQAVLDSAKSRTCDTLKPHNR